MDIRDDNIKKLNNIKHVKLQHLNPQFSRETSPSSLNSTKLQNKSYIINFEEENDKNMNYSPYIIKIGKNFDHDFCIFDRRLKKENKCYFPFSKQTKTEKLSDRFIPLNSGIDLIQNYKLSNINKNINQNKHHKNRSRSRNNINKNNNLNITFDELLRNNIIHKDIVKMIYPKYSLNKNIDHFFKEKILSFKISRNLKENLNSKPISIINYQEEENNNINQRKRNITPYKEIFINNLLDDFYFNLLDWSEKNIIAIACKNSVLLWNYNKSISDILLEYKADNILRNNKIISSLIFSPHGEKIAIGNSLGKIEIYDTEYKKLIVTYSEHLDRLGTIAWNKNIISSGSKDCSIINYDIRTNHIINKFLKHEQEICGLKWSFDGKKLASGGNDNMLYIWNINSHKPIMQKNEHIAAVKALAWSPRRYGILATGGGTTDKTIRLWNTVTGEQIIKHDTKSQVCNLVFSKNSNELVSTHGYSFNHINIWNVNTMKNVGTLIGHDFRVLYLALSPDGQNIATAAGDQVIKFWNIFPKENKAFDNRLLPSDRELG